MSSRAEDQGLGASTGTEGNPEHDVALPAASDSGSSNTSSTTSTTSGGVGALNVESAERPPDRNDAPEPQRAGPQGRTDQAPRDRNDAPEPQRAGPQGRTDQAPRGRNDDDRGLLKLDKTFLGLTFQAGLALMIYRNQPQQGDSSSANPSLLSSILFTSVGAATLFGFAFTMSGMMLKKHHPNAANFCSYAGVFLGALGFFFMMDIFAGKGLDWLVWAVGGVLLLVFAYTLRREMGV